MCKRTILWTLAIVAILVGTFSCSREKGIVENPLLKNGVMQVLVLKQRPTDVQALLDSIDQIPRDSIDIQDTVVATKNDSLFVVGRLNGGKPEQVRDFFWAVTGREPVFGRSNNDLYVVTFSDTGSYQTVFKARDDLGGRDSAGIGQWIRIINTEPVITVASDTVRAKRLGPALTWISATDSMGMVDSIRVDYDADGIWDTTYAYGQSDSIQIRVPRISARVDSLSNQRTVLQAFDDDGNFVLDTLVVHFNILPVISQTYPNDSSRVSIFERFAFYWNASDLDNPLDLRYNLRVAKVPVLTNTHLVISNTTQRSWEQVSATGILTDTSLYGNLYWQVIATDGFDTVISPVRKFFLGDPSVRFGTITGVARMQAQTDHRGIQITLFSLANGARQITATGSIPAVPVDRWRFTEVEAGCYRVEARDTVDLFYSVAVREQVCVDIGESVSIDTLLLLDQSKPKIRVTSITDTLVTQRSLAWVGTFADSGSFVNVASVRAWINGDSIALVNPTALNWTVNMTALRDGPHQLTMVARDNANNISDTLKVNFAVRATKINLTVNGGGGALVRDNDSLHFVLEVTDPSPAVDRVFWSLLGDASVFQSQDSVGDFVDPVWFYRLDTAIATAFSGTRQMIATLRNESGYQYRDTVSYQVRERNVASVLIVNPGQDTTVGLNDVVAIKARAVPSEGYNIVSMDWDLDGNGTYETTGAAADSVRNFSKPSNGTYKIRVRATDNNVIPQVAYDSISIAVMSSPPQVRVVNDRDTVRINGDIHLDAIVSDNGTIALIEWQCGSEDWQVSPVPFATIVAPPAAGTIDCIIRVTDDDNETALDTTIVLVKLDKPYVKVLQDSATVTIKDSLKLKAQAMDTLGTIVSYQWNCGKSIGASGWITVSKSDTVLFAPATEELVWYCVIRVTDNDGLTAMDTTKYMVLLDRPRVQVLDSSMVIKINDPISLDAVAFDSLGRIVEYAWSCGGGGTIGGATNPWQIFPSPVATITAPSVGNPNYLCVIRVTDDDGLTARDTVHINLTQGEPQVSVVKKWVSARVNTNFTVDCEANDAFGQIDHYEWSCGAAGVAGTNGTWLLLASSWYIATAPAAGDPNYLCIVRAYDDDNQFAEDTVHVVVVQPPQAILQVSDSIIVWSGDNEIPEKYKYWGAQINGSASQIGVPLGDPDSLQYWWHFSNYQDVWLLGQGDGTIDPGYSGFSDALIRPTAAGNITVMLDFRDSILPAGETDSTAIYDFLIRHFDDESILVKFYRAWRNVNAPGDTIVQPASRGMSLVTDATNNPIVAYRSSTDSTGWVKRWDGSAWQTVGGGSFGTRVDSIRLARDTSNNDLIVAYRNTANGGIVVKRSTAGTANWAILAGNPAVNGNNTRNLAIAANNTQIALAWVGADSAAYITRWTGSAWAWGGSASALIDSSANTDVSKVVLAFSKNADSLAVGYSTLRYNTTSRFWTMLRVARIPADTWAYLTQASSAADAPAIAYAPNGRIYMAFNDRTVFGPRVRYRAGGSWTNVVTAGYAGNNVSLHTVGRALSIQIDASNRPVVAYDDNFFSPYVNVWRYEGAEWILLGESKLPYFASAFFDANGYYLRGIGPSLSISPNGTIYVGMMGLDGRGASGANNGPIVMKYAP